VQLGLMPHFGKAAEALSCCIVAMQFARGR
jgi:hypothetical protein